MENSLVVITNASSGIGQELARQFGEENFELVICSPYDEIFSIQKELEHEGYQVEAIKVNLASYKGIENLFYRIQKYGKQIDTFVINSETIVEGNFFEGDLKSDIKSINTNVLSTVHLLKRITSEMIMSEEGNILISLPSSSNAIEQASASFLYSFVNTLRKEMKDRGLGIATLSINADDEDDFQETARYTVESLRAGRKNIYPDSLMAKIHNYATRILPDKNKEQSNRY